MFNKSEKPIQAFFDLSPFLPKPILDILNKYHANVRLNYMDTHPGDSSHPVLVLIHGNSSSIHAFDDVIKHNSGKYRIIAMDLLGNGLSTKVSNLNNISERDKHTLGEALYHPLTMIASIRHLLEAKKISKANLLGWSLGGHFAFGVAVENPELVASIITIGTPPVLFSQNGIKKGFSEWFVNVLVPQWVNQPTYYSLKDAREIGKAIGFVGQDLENLAQDMTTTDPLMRKYVFAKLAEFDEHKYLGSALDGNTFVTTTEIPQCHLVGNQDTGINTNLMEEVDKEMQHPLSSVHLISNASHAVLQTHKEVCYTIIDDFIVRTGNQSALVFNG